MQAASRRKLMSAAKNDRSEKQNRDQQRITVMLISVVVVFLICQMPQALTHLFRVYLNATKTMTKELNINLRIAGRLQDTGCCLFVSTYIRFFRSASKNNSKGYRIFMKIVVWRYLQYSFMNVFTCLCISFVYVVNAF